jgi:hypothetical protein
MNVCHTPPEAPSPIRPTELPSVPAAPFPDVSDERILSVRYYPEDGTTTHMWVGLDRYIYLSSTVAVGRIPSPPMRTWSPPAPPPPKAG